MAEIMTGVAKRPTVSKHAPVWHDSLATSNSDGEHVAVTTRTTGAPGHTTRSKKLLGAHGIATRSKGATRGSFGRSEHHARDVPKTSLSARKGGGLPPNDRRKHQ